MQSKANLSGHPIHPMLIPFPIAFLTGAFFADLAGLLTANPAWWINGKYLSLAGIVCGLAAAVPGFIDYLYTVPPRSSGKVRATYHMLLNVSALALFAAAWRLRGDLDHPGSWTLFLEFAGLVLLAAGGWFGGALAYRNQIGVDHRYAQAGRWKDERIATDDVAVAGKDDELKTNQMKLLRAGSRRIVEARTERGYCAFDDRCTHKGGSLAGGILACGTVTCPWHGSQFEVETGRVVSGPAKDPISTYPVEQGGGEVRIRLQQQSSRL